MNSHGWFRVHINKIGLLKMGHIKNQITILTTLALLWTPTIFAANEDVNIIVHTANHTPQNTVHNTEIALVQRYARDEGFYFFPNNFSGTGYQFNFSHVLDGKKSVAVVTHQRVEKGVPTAKIVEFHYRMHTNQGVSSVHIMSLAFNTTNVAEEYNLLTNTPDWASAQFTLPHLENAHALEFWFKFTTANGNIRWDSNNGENYFLSVAPSAGTTVSISNAGDVSVEKNSEHDSDTKSLRVKYGRSFEACRMVGYVYFDGNKDKITPFSVYALNKEGLNHSIEGFATIPENANTASIFFEPAPYQYTCKTNHDPASAEAWVINLR